MKTKPKQKMNIKLATIVRLRNFTALLLGSSILLLLQSASHAGVFAKLDGIDGESADANHDKWIDVLSIDWGSDKPGGGATGQSPPRGGAVVEDFILAIEYDKASPKLQEACLEGNIIPKVEIEVTGSRDGAPQEPYLKYKFQNVSVTSCSVFITGEGILALRVSMSFAEISQTYTDGEGNETTLTVGRTAKKRGRDRGRNAVDALPNNHNQLWGDWFLIQE
jgi:type VI secretion system Hcp family effector